VVTRSQQMLGYDSNYVPGWDCHGLPIEWKIEEEYRAKGRNKDAVPVIEFRRECRAFARTGSTCSARSSSASASRATGPSLLDHGLSAEAQIARELMKFAQNGTLYRGSKPVMWSVVEKTALAEAEVEYEDYTSDQVWVKFPIANPPADCKALGRHLDHHAVDAAGNRAISFSPRIEYGLYESPMRRPTIGPRPATAWCSPTSSRPT
jgi:isoleucyl-tRNA synthetase